MKIKWGALVVDGSGKSNGHVASKNRGGSYLRTKVTPTNPQSADQIAARARVTTNSKAWGSLTDAQRQSWNSAVDSYKKTDIFGDLKRPTGLNLYTRLNNLLMLVGASPITTPPLPTEVGYLTTATVVADNSSNSVTLTYAPVIPAGENLVVRATPALAPGKSFVKNQQRIIGVYAAADVSPLVLTTDYQAKFGDVGAVGQKIHFEFEMINNTTGLKGARTSVSTTIVA